MNMGKAAVFGTAALVVALALRRRYLDVRTVAHLQESLATYLDDPLPRNDRKGARSGRKAAAAPDASKGAARSGAGAAAGADTSSAGDAAGLSASGTARTGRSTVPPPALVRTNTHTKRWFGPVVNLAELAQEIEQATAPVVRYRPRAHVVRDVLSMGVRGRLSARRERTSELLVSLRMRGVLSERDLIDGINLFVRRLPRSELCAKRVVKLLCHLVSAEVVGDTQALAGLPDDADAIVDTALRGGMRVLKQRRGVRAVVNEFLWNGDVDELLDAVVTGVPRRYRYEVIKKLVQTTLSRGHQSKEQASSMMNTLVKLGVVSVDQAVEGFYRVLWCVSELRLDAPNAADVVGRYMARAIADKVLPYNFLYTIPDTVLQCKPKERPRVGPTGGPACSAAAASVHVAKALVEEAYAGQEDADVAHNRLRNVWGVSVVSLDRVQNLKGDIDHTLRKAVKLGAVAVTTPEEEVAAPQAREKAAQRAVQVILEMSCPHYHHEVVRQCCSLAVEKPTKETRLLLLHVLHKLEQRGGLTPKDVQKGCIRLIEEVDEMAASGGADTAKHAALMLVRMTEEMPELLPPTWCTLQSLHASLLQRLRRCVQDKGAAPVASKVLAMYEEDYY